MSKEHNILLNELLVINRFQNYFLQELEGTDIAVSIKNGIIVLLAKYQKELDFLKLTFKDPDYRFEGKYAVSCIMK